MKQSTTANMQTPIYSGVPVHIHSLLPWPETVEICNIESKEIYRIETGRLINCIQANGSLYVSKEMYSQIRKL